MGQTRCMSAWSANVGSFVVTETVNPMASPAETEGLSADLATSMAAPRTSTEAEAVSDPSLVVVRSEERRVGKECGVGGAGGEERGKVVEAEPARAGCEKLEM